MYVELNNVNKNFGNFLASDQVNFGIAKGQLIGLLGPSGSGKTTILRMIAGLENPDSGDIFIDGKRVNDIAPSKRGIGFVFQSYALFRYMTVFENIAFGLKIRKVPKKEIKERVSELLNLVGLGGLENRYPHQLSGGQRQRVAFVRAIAPNPSLLLLDEPFAAIDAKVRQELRLWLREMIEKLGITSIFVTHDQDEAIEVADEIIIVNGGRIEQKGSPFEIYKNPSTAFVAQFIGQSTVLDDVGRFHGYDTYQGANKAIIRPEFIKIAKSHEIHENMSAYEEGVIEDVIFKGSYLEIKVKVKESTLTGKRLNTDEPVQIGEKVRVLIYRMQGFCEEETYLLTNSLLTDSNSIFI